MKKFLAVLLLLILLSGCRPTLPNMYRRYVMTDFDFKAANLFIEQMDSLLPVDNISLTDLPKTGKEFRVNGQHIFTDTTYTDMPNFYNYKKRAAEINVSHGALLRALNSFYDIHTNTGLRKDGFYMFSSESYLTYEKGYIYSTKNLIVGDSIAMGRTYYITHQIDAAWFEYKYPK